MHVIQGESAVNGGQNATAFSGVENYMDFMAKVRLMGVQKHFE